ncbi:carbohydrate-binding module family 13 protein [Rhizophagus clarus]|uniref:Carbohydrate-binding module family 13 protein n=1 Tax=Rhizophagus clarus TaxID=94130 RepID=A0A8H3LDD5_9GLOM|nr:carbohydrate-binding module family 13 protein [Rhizophagus clarus]
MDYDEFLPKLSQNYLEILNDEEYFDITIEVEIFQAILTYIYGGRLSLTKYDTPDILKILIAASELNLQELVIHLQSFLIQIKANWIERNFNLVYQTSFECDSFLDLQQFCRKLIIRQPEKIFNSPDFTSLPEKTLISLVQQDNLQMSEVQVWEHVLKWGIAKNPELSSDPSSYSDDEFNTLKDTIHRCIPFIKFLKFTPKEFLNKAYPYRKILPGELFDNLIAYFLDNDYNPNKRSEPQQVVKSSPKGINSKIITFQHAKLISKWIDRLRTMDELKNLYEFKLIFRGSRDGFSAEKFHKICDNQSRTVTVIKVKDSNEILGGYNPIKWDSRYSYNCYGTTRDSFIFSFVDKSNVRDYVLSRVKNEKQAMNYLPHHGPSFGPDDLVIYGGREHSFNNDHSYCKKMSYEKQIRETEEKFSVEEYEVFQIST